MAYPDLTANISTTDNSGYWYWETYPPYTVAPPYTQIPGTIYVTPPQLTLKRIIEEYDSEGRITKKIYEYE